MSERTYPQLAAELLLDAKAGRYPQLTPKEARTAGYALQLVAEEGWPETQHATPTAPNTPAGYSDEVVERAVALVRDIEKRAASHGWNSWSDEARAIVALLPEPVDANEQYARDLIREQGWQDEREIGSEAVVRMIAMARRQSPHRSKGE